MVAITGGQPQRSALDYSLCFCVTILLLLVILLIDAYEYITVPGAKHARNHISTGYNLAGEKIHTGVESLTGLELMTKAEKEEMKREIEEAREIVHKKHAEVEEIVEKVEELEKEAHKPDAPAPVPVNAEEKAVEEEKKEEIVETLVEKQLGLENWCGDCKWKTMGFTCDQRVKYMIEKYEISEVEAKEANIEACTRRRLRG